MQRISISKSVGDCVQLINIFIYKKKKLLTISLSVQEHEKGVGSPSYPRAVDGDYKPPALI